jgi:hypothetical protein
MPNIPRPSVKETLAAGAATPPDAAAILDDYFTDIECPAELGIAPLTLAIWRTQRKGPPVTRVGRKVYYRKASVRAWLQSQERPPSTLNPATVRP